MNAQLKYIETGIEGCRFEIVAPNGRSQSSVYWADKSDALIDAQKRVDEMLSRTCGDGKPLHYHKHLVEMIFGIGQWLLRKA